MQEKQQAHTEDKAMGCFKMIFQQCQYQMRLMRMSVFFNIFFSPFFVYLLLQWTSRSNFTPIIFLFGVGATLRFDFTFILTGFIKFQFTCYIFFSHTFLKYLHVKQILFLKANYFGCYFYFLALFYCLFFIFYNFSGTKQSTNTMVSVYREVNSLLIHTLHLRMWFFSRQRGSVLQKRNMYYLRTYQESTALYECEDGAGILEVVGACRSCSSHQQGQVAPGDSRTRSSCHPAKQSDIRISPPIKAREAPRMATGINCLLIGQVGCEESGPVRRLQIIPFITRLI